jgi:hypothetical protein
MKYYCIRILYLELSTYLLKGVIIVLLIENRLHVLHHEGPVCFLGDFNAHTGKLDDYGSIDNSIIEFLDIQNDMHVIDNVNILNECGVPLLRASQDKCKHNNYGSKLIELCKSLNLFIVTGRFGHDRNVGHTTCNNMSLFLLNYFAFCPISKYYRLTLYLVMFILQ